MKENNELAKSLARNLKKKTIRKYALMALAVVIVISSAIGLNIESKDSTLPDGQGNITVAEQGAGEQAIDEQSIDKQADNKQNAENETEKTPSKNENNSLVLETAKPQTSVDKKPTKLTPEESKVDNTKDPTASNDGNSALKPEEEELISVTISIRCDTISNDMSKLTDKSVAAYIPANGVILDTITYKCTTDNTVFDVLNTVCRNNGIHLDFSYESLYEAYYIKGINYLYHFDAGDTSGWMFKVNGWFPNYGCSSYYLSDGDIIEWVYTCDLGADVGDNYMG